MSFASDPNYVSYDFSAFNGNATNGSQGGLASLSQVTPAAPSTSSMMAGLIGNPPVV